MITEKKAANAMGGNTARACDSCMVKRARWFCGADDAFLCQRCDASVHSANLLASRHERVRLKSSSHKLGDHLTIEPPVPAWQQGVTRKARTPRGHGNHKSSKDEVGKVLHQSMPFVPEIGSEEVDYCCLEDDHESEDLEQLLYRVPIFDRFEAELCNNMTNIDHHEVKMGIGLEVYGARSSSPCDELDNLQGLLLPSDMELADFAADVENMLGKGLDEDCSDIKGLGLLDGTKEEEDYGMDVCIGIEERKLVKVEEEDQGMECEFNPSMLDWSLDYDDESAAVLLGGSTSPDQEEEEEEKVAVLMEAEKKRKKICLRLNHEAVISAWASQGSPWTTGVKPELNPDDGWPDCMGIWGTNKIMNLQGHGNSSAAAYRMGMRGDTEQRPGREARVSRYREKRRTRLFSKKIRYEVRKLNAEKRPRMKGRFVKRTSFQMGMGTNTTPNTPTTTNAPPYQQHQQLKT